MQRRIHTNDQHWNLGREKPDRVISLTNALPELYYLCFGVVRADAPEKWVVAGAAFLSPGLCMGGTEKSEVGSPIAETKEATAIPQEPKCSSRNGKHYECRASISEARNPSGRMDRTNVHAEPISRISAKKNITGTRMNGLGKARIPTKGRAHSIKITKPDVRRKKAARRAVRRIDRALAQANEVVLWFGKYDGLALKSVPTKYLRWLKREYDHEFLKAAVSRVLKARRRGRAMYEAPPLVELPKQELRAPVSAPRSGHIEGETPWQKQLKQACSCLDGFAADVPSHMGYADAVADLDCEGTAIGLLDLDRKDDVGRINQLCRAAIKPTIILKGHGAHTVAPGLDSEGREVIGALRASHNCQVLVQQGDQLFWQEADQWVPATSELAQRILPVLLDSGGKGTPTTIIDKEGCRN